MATGATSGRFAKHEKMMVSVSFHLLELRDLWVFHRAQPGRPNPYVVIHCFGRREQTAIQRATQSCLYDRHILFKDVETTMAEFEEASLVVRVFNAVTFGRDVLIGQFMSGSARSSSRRSARCATLRRTRTRGRRTSRS